MLLKHLRSWKNLLSKTMKKPAQEMGIYTLSKICMLAVWKGQNCPSGRPPVDRPTVIFLTVEPPVDRGLDTESRALCRLTARSTGTRSRKQSSLVVDWVGRPALQPIRPVHVRAHRSTDFCLGRPSGRPTEGQVKQ